MQFKITFKIGVCNSHDIKKGKDGPWVSNLLPQTLWLCHLEREKEGLNPWSEEKDEREIPLTLPDAASLGQLVLKKKWALFSERCPPVLMFFLVRKERLIAPSPHLLREFTCCDTVSEKKSKEPAWISKTNKQTNNSKQKLNSSHKNNNKTP